MDVTGVTQKNLKTMHYYLILHFYKVSQKSNLSQTMWWHLIPLFFSMTIQIQVNTNLQKVSWEPYLNFFSPFLRLLTPENNFGCQNETNLYHRYNRSSPQNCTHIWGKLSITLLILCNNLIGSLPLFLQHYNSSELGFVLQNRSKKIR